MSTVTSGQNTPRPVPIETLSEFVTDPQVQAFLAGKSSHLPALRTALATNIHLDAEVFETLYVNNPGGHVSRLLVYEVAREFERAHYKNKPTSAQTLAKFSTILSKGVSDKDLREFATTAHIRPDMMPVLGKHPKVWSRFWNAVFSAMEVDWNRPGPAKRIVMDVEFVHEVRHQLPPLGTLALWDLDPETVTPEEFRKHFWDVKTKAVPQGGRPTFNALARRLLANRPDLVPLAARSNHAGMLAATSGSPALTEPIDQEWAAGLRSPERITFTQRQELLRAVSINPVTHFEVAQKCREQLKAGQERAPIFVEDDFTFHDRRKRADANTLSCQIEERLLRGLEGVDRWLAQLVAENTLPSDLLNQFGQRLAVAFDIVQEVTEPTFMTKSEEERRRLLHEAAIAVLNSPVITWQDPSDRFPDGENDDLDELLDESTQVVLDTLGSDLAKWDLYMTLLDQDTDGANDPLSAVRAVFD